MVKSQTLISWAHFAVFGTESTFFAKCILHVIIFQIRFDWRLWDLTVSFVFFIVAVLQKWIVQWYNKLLNVLFVLLNRQGIKGCLIKMSWLKNYVSNWINFYGEVFYFVREWFFHLCRNLERFTLFSAIVVNRDFTRKRNYFNVFSLILKLDCSILWWDNWI